MAAGYTFSKTANVTTITYNNGTATSTLWAITGQVQLRATAFTANDAEYRISQAGVQDVVIPYSEITAFTGATPPTGDPILDFALLVGSFPTLAA